MNNQEQNNNFSNFNPPLRNNNEKNQTFNANTQTNQVEKEAIKNEKTSNTIAQQILLDPLMQPMNNENTNNLGKSKNNEQKPTINNNSYNNNFYSDEELLRAFIGYNFEKVATNRFNFSAFFFSSFYFLYRKMYLIGIILVVLSAAISYFLKATFIIMILISIISDYAFNYLYRNFARKNIERIKANNTTDDIKAICTRKGGTNILLAILVLIGYIIFATIFLTTATFGSLFSGFISASEASENAFTLQIDTSAYIGFCNEDYEECTVQYPYSDDESNISCSLDDKNSPWHITSGYTLGTESSSCEEFMTAIYDYSNLTEKEFPDSGEIIITSEGLIENNGTKFIYGNKTCTYNSNNNKFECK